MKTFLKLALLLIVSWQHNAFASAPAIQVNPSRLAFAGFYEKYIAIGQSKLSNSKDYFARVAGKVDYISDVQGSELAKNDILITIDRDIAEKLKAEAEANLYLAQSNYDRDLSLLKKKIISEEGINKSKLSLEQAKNEYTKALNTYDDMVIKAPEGGYVGVVKANIGDEVKIGDYLFSLIAKSDFYVFVELPQIMHGKVSTNDVVTVKNQHNKVTYGKILAISDYVSNNGTITAKLEFPYSNDLLHGAFVEAEIVFNRHKALALPEKAVLKNNQGDFIYVITPENKAKQVYVKLGIRTNDMIELLSTELKEGDMIVVDGLTKVYDGAAVIVQE
jgi:RND family efflux transporter MFP subunit